MSIIVEGLKAYVFFIILYENTWKSKYYYEMEILWKEVSLIKSNTEKLKYQGYIQSSQNECRVS